MALHGAALGALIAAPAAAPWVAGLCFADHCLLTAHGLSPRSSALGPNLRRIATPGTVALTFDDGPDPAVTPRVLDELDRWGHRASFFCIGERVRRHPELVGEIVRRGHRVENHTDRHLGWFSCLPPGGLARELDRAQAVITAATGRPPEYFRAPAGLRSAWLEPLLAERGLRLVSWTRRSLDTVDRDPERVLGRLTRGLAEGDILVLHDGNSARTAAGEPVAWAVLAGLAARLAARGLRTEPLG